MDGSKDTGARYYARHGKVFAQPRDGGSAYECGSALSAHGRELERFEAALNEARRQREVADERLWRHDARA